MVSLADLADWSPWLPYDDARRCAPCEPGVFLLREPCGQVRYVGTAGERAAGGRPQGVRGRLGEWAGRGPLTGFAQVALDLALGDVEWVEQQLHRLRYAGPSTTRDWAHRAVRRLDLQVCWAVTAERADAAYLEKQVVALLREELWSR